MVSVVEIWRSAPGLKGRYEVSNLGRVRSTRNNRVRKLKVSKSGYVLLTVAECGQTVNVPVAHLVCGAFNGPRPEGSDCDHLNRVRSDNLPENLRWCSRAENLANRENASGEQHWTAKLTSESVRLIRSTPYRRGVFTHLANRFGVSRQTVRDVMQRKEWRSLP